MIALFTYNRPLHTRRALEALSRCEGATLEDLRIFSDAAHPSATAEAKNNVAATRELLREKRWDDAFRSVEITERPANMGLARNIIFGLTQLFRESDEIIVLEDDLECAPDFLVYMRGALEHYRGKGVWCVSGYTPAVKLPAEYKYDTYAIPRNCSWGWATWRENWQKVDWELKDFEKFDRDLAAQRRFNTAGDDLTPMLQKCQMGRINSWSIKFCYAGFLAGMNTIYPRVSRLRNIGADGSGTNMRPSAKYDTATTADNNSPAAPGTTERKAVAYCPPDQTDPQTLKAFRKFYDLSPVRKLINWITL